MLAVITAKCIAKKCRKNHSLTAPRSASASADHVSSPLTSAVSASHPVTCSQCKYQHKAATAAAAPPSDYIRCRTRLSLHPSFSSSLLLLHAFVPNLTTRQPVSLQEQIRLHTSFLSMPAESRELGRSPPALQLTSSLFPLGRKEYDS